MIEELIAFGLRVAELVALVAFPLMVWSLGGRLMHALDTIEYFHVPGLARLSFLAGAILGFLSLFVTHDPQWYEFDAVFLQGGPWDLSFRELFQERLNPSLYNPAPLAERLATLDPTDGVVVAGAVAGAFLAVVFVSAFVYFFEDVAHAILLSALVFLWGAGLAIYVVSAGAWALHVLNFWAVIIAFFVYRSRSLHTAH